MELPDSINKGSVKIPDSVNCIIFDLDGTLAHFPIDYPAMRSELRRLFGVESEFSPLIGEVRRLAGSGEMLKKAFEIIDRYECASVDKSSPVNEGLRIYMSAGEKKRAIMTRNGKKMLAAFLKKYSLPAPDSIASRDDVERMKPDREHFDFISSALKVKAEECLLVGDSPHDKELAERAGLRFLEIS